MVSVDTHPPSGSGIMLEDIKRGAGLISFTCMLFIIQKILSVSEWLQLYTYILSSVTATSGGEGTSIKSSITPGKSHRESIQIILTILYSLCQLTVSGDLMPCSRCHCV